MNLPEDVGLRARWAEHERSGNRPALFLDRDGVLVEEVHFLRRVEDIRILDGMVAAVAAANAAGIPVVVVTNQSGIARGHFGWPEFGAVQSAIEAQLAEQGAWIDAVFACGYLESGQPPYDRAHAWRKPGPGMLQAAADRMDLDLARSAIIGDRVSDLEAGFNAGLSRGTLVLTGYGATEAPALTERQEAWNRRGFVGDVVAEPAAAVHAAIRRLSPQPV